MCYNSGKTFLLVSESHYKYREFITTLTPEYTFLVLIMVLIMRFINKQECFYPYSTMLPNRHFFCKQEFCMCMLDCLRELTLKVQ